MRVETIISAGRYFWGDNPYVPNSFGKVGMAFTEAFCFCGEKEKLLAVDKFAAPSGH